MCNDRMLLMQRKKQLLVFFLFSQSQTQNQRTSFLSLQLLTPLLFLSSCHFPSLAAPLHNPYSSSMVARPPWLCILWSRHHRHQSRLYGWDLLHWVDIFSARGQGSLGRDLEKKGHIEARKRQPLRRPFIDKLCPSSRFWQCYRGKRYVIL